jgi:cytochrome c biogenesis protein CcmG/thiol:disulfide interchange protein DsbE
MTMSDAVLDAPLVESRRRRVGPSIAVAVLVVLAVFIGVLATRPAVSDRQGSSPLLNKAAPLIDAPTTAGERFRLGDYKGQWVVVNFMASWCAACKVEHPELLQFVQRHAAVGDAEVVAVAISDAPNDTAAFFAKRGGDWPVVMDTSGAYAVSYGIVKLPESYLVDPNGFVRVKFIGGLTADGIDKQILART